MEHICKHQLGTRHAYGFSGSNVVHSHNPVSNPLADGLVIETVEIKLVPESPLGYVEQKCIEQLPVFLQHFLHDLDPERRFISGRSG